MRVFTHVPCALVVAIATACSFVLVSSACPAAEATDAARAAALPRPLEDVRVDEHLGARLPLDGIFTDESGKVVKLADYTGRQQPLVVTLNYSRCPMLCSLMLGALASAIRGIPLVPGKDFTVVTIDLDPHATPDTSRRSRRRYTAEAGASPSIGGWHFLVGEKTAIDAVARAVGYRYRFDPESGEYYHPAVVAIATPEGRLARYLYGIDYSPDTLRLSLAEASEGRVASTLDRVLLFCSTYDPRRGGYSIAVARLLRLGAALVLTALAAFLFVLWRREWRATRAGTSD